MFDAAVHLVLERPEAVTVLPDYRSGLQEGDIFPRECQGSPEPGSLAYTRPFQLLSQEGVREGGPCDGLCSGEGYAGDSDEEPTLWRTQQGEQSGAQRALLHLTLGEVRLKMF